MRSFVSICRIFLFDVRSPTKEKIPERFRKGEKPLTVVHSKPDVSVLLRALFKGGGFAAQVRQNFAREMQ